MTACNRKFLIKGRDIYASSKSLNTFPIIKQSTKRHVPIMKVMLGVLYEYMRVPSRSRGKKVIDTRESALHFPRTNRRGAARRDASVGSTNESRTRRTSTPGVGTRRRQGTARGAFLSPGGANPGSPPSSSSSSFSLYHPPPRRPPVVFVLFCFLLRETTKAIHDDEAEVEGRRTRAAVRERETIPVEEGPFCPAHPTRSFRRPWSH